MIKIENADLLEIKNWYIAKVAEKEYFEERTAGIYFNACDKTKKNNYKTKKPNYKKNKKKFNEILVFCRSNKSDIIGATSSEMGCFAESFILHFGSKIKESDAYLLFKAYMDRNYDAVTKDIGYDLVRKLGITVCPYCNRQYIFTVDSESKKIRAQYDHFYPKSEHPYLALSFCNLIPCCSVCNQLKRIKPIGVNPYVKGFEDDCKFTVDNVGKCIFQEKEEWNIALSNNTGDYKKNIDEFAINELYKQHKDYVEEIIFKARAYNEGYYDELITAFPNIGLAESEMKRIVFGNYVKMEQLDKRPLSKLTKDILDQLEIK